MRTGGNASLARRAVVSGILAVALAAVGPRPAEAQFILVPMDRTQTNHLKAYGLTYWTLEQGVPAEWLLNYRGGAFLLPDLAGVQREAVSRKQAKSSGYLTR